MNCSSTSISKSPNKPITLSFRKLGAITKVEKSVGWTFDINFCYCEGAAKC